MKKSLMFVMISQILIFSFDYKYDEVFINTYRETIDFIEQNKSKFRDELGEEFRKEKIAVVFPELLKYSLYQDVLETKALELLYVNYGKESMDFSIGYFQMKPSFIEKLEKKIMNDKSLMNKYALLVEYNASSDKSIRKERVLRLKTLRWQLKYLNCFYDMMNNEFEFLKKEKPGERIRFMSTAYNYDFTKSKEEIDKWIYKRIFPYGLGKGKNQYAYSDIAVFYYANQ